MSSSEFGEFDLCPISNVHIPSICRLKTGPTRTQFFRVCTPVRFSKSKSHKIPLVVLKILVANKVFTEMIITNKVPLRKMARWDKILLPKCQAFRTASCLLSTDFQNKTAHRSVLVLHYLASSRFPRYLTWLTFRYCGVTVSRTFHYNFLLIW